MLPDSEDSEDNVPSPEDFTLAFGDMNTQPKNPGLIRGLKRQAVLQFIEYLKSECNNGQITDTFDMEIIPLTFTELDGVGERFLGR